MLWEKWTSLHFTQEVLLIACPADDASACPCHSKTQRVITSHASRRGDAQGQNLACHGRTGDDEDTMLVMFRVGEGVGMKKGFT